MSRAHPIGNPNVRSYISIAVPFADAARILGAAHAVGLHTEGWEHFTETRADLGAAFAGMGLLVETPPGVAVGIGPSPAE
ncbi:hypothetical protein V6245_10655 [Salinibacterium amurskyense]|uniref:hypothetical protein n=1 Tax=Salinibacterium amurskyense TaxID=205941 RepID=UPI00311E68BF